ncbi:MAG: DUF2089 family protein [Candidatus Hydrogenedentales bacterium]
MDTKKPVSASCPYCGGGMRTTAMSCAACNVEVRGRFRESLFQQLSDPEQQFLESFLLADFSIKELANRSGMGYQAIRTRLDRLIETYQGLRNAEDQKKRILERVALGEISATEGANLIRGLDNGRS